jgi:hypothetical protein
VLPLETDEFSVTLPPLQKVVGPLGEITGAEGIGFTVTVTGEEDAEVQVPEVAVTV